MDSDDQKIEEGLKSLSAGRVEITVRLFALARQLASSDTLVVSVAEPAMVRDVRRAIGEKCPALAGLMGQMLIAVDSDYARDDTPVNARCEVACIPPVSGGCRRPTNKYVRR